MGLPTIVGWSSTDKVPGVGGETIFGSGPASAASIPLLLLIVGTKLAAGSATPNQDIVPILSPDDADVALGAGCEAAVMCYGALRTPGVTIFCAPVAEAGGAVAATQVITIAGSPTSAGSWFYRFNGVAYTGGINLTDTPTTIALAISNAVNADVRCPFTAVPVAGVVTLTVKSKGARGNAYLSFQDTSKLAAGITSTISGPTWTTLTAGFTVGKFITPVTPNGFYFKATAITTGTTGASEPTWPTTIGATVVDAGVTWTCWGLLLNGGITSFGGGTGTELNTTLLSVLAPALYDRIACAEADATNLAAWKTQLDSQAGPTNNLTQHLVTALNGTLALATAPAQTTLNHPRFQVLWYLNSETHPAILAATFAAIRVATEQGDPDAAYDDVILPGVAPQSQKLDWASHATLISALNNSVTPIYTSPDGYAKICRSIQTRSLNGSTPDYRVLDTSDAIVPDFVRRSIALAWTTGYKIANPRVSDDPPANQKDAASGVATPARWSNFVEGMLRSFERGDGFPAPIIINVDTLKPSSGYDKVAKRIVSAIPVQAAPNNHQVGISVRGV